jgi:hypothetical protein
MAKSSKAVQDNIVNALPYQATNVKVATVTVEVTNNLIIEPVDIFMPKSEVAIGHSFQGKHAMILERSLEMTQRSCRDHGLTIRKITIEIDKDAFK